MRRVAIRTDHGDPDRARAIAAALRPDNTASMATTVADGAVTTTIERPSTGGLRSTADDYVVNLRAATRVLGGEATVNTDSHTNETDTTDTESDDT